VSRLRTVIDRAGPARATIKSRPAQHLIQAARGARAVREPLRFAARQFGRPRVAGYRLRAYDITVFLRHRSRDVNILNEIFGGTAGRKSYEPPARLAAQLDAARAPRVLDLGANIGLFGAYVLGRWPQASIESFEPDPSNARLLVRLIAANRRDLSWSVSELAVANRAGELEFAAGMHADSHVLLQNGARAEDALTARNGSPSVITVRAVDLFDQRHDVDLLKMDIEGAEWPILADPRLATLRARAIALEWHAAGCPDEEPRATCLRLLRSAGYSGLHEADRGRENGLVWAWREPHAAGGHAPAI
jgi:FkbM family methyltransferase